MTSQAVKTVAVGIIAAMLLASASACVRRQTPREPMPAAPVSTPAAPATVAPEPSPTPSPTVTPVQKQVTVRAYFTRGETIAVVGRSAVAPALASGAMKALLAGPTPTEKSAGIGTQIPSGTKLLGLTINNGTATVNLSSRFESGGGTLSMTLRIAQVVSTLTQFPSVTRVAFRLDGKPVTSIGGEGLIVSPPVDRADYEDVFPAILPETPLPGATAARPVVVAGTANVFEAQFRVSVLDAKGRVIADIPVKATSGTGIRGTFRTAISFPSGNAGRGTVRFYDPSEKDGTPTGVVDVPVVLR